MADVEMGEDSSRIMARPDLLERVCRADGLFHLMHDVVDAEMIAAATKLRVIASMAIIPATVDVAAATARKIPVTTIPPIVTEATADLNWALLMAVARRVVEGDAALRRRHLSRLASRPFQRSLRTRKDYGDRRSGSHRPRRRAAGSRLRHAHPVHQAVPPERSGRARTRRNLRFLEDLLRQADFVSINAAFTPETRHLIGARELSLMKPTAFLVNTSRGPLVDEGAPREALRSRRIAGAGLDVYEQEPHVHPGLLSLAQVVLTPHLGSAVAELREQMAHVVVDNIQAVLRGERPPNLYNREVYP